MNWFEKLKLLFLCRGRRKLKLNLLLDTAAKSHYCDLDLTVTTESGFTAIVRYLGHSDKHVYVRVCNRPVAIKWWQLIDDDFRLDAAMSALSDWKKNGGYSEMVLRWTWLNQQHCRPVDYYVRDEKRHGSIDRYLQRNHFDLHNLPTETMKAKVPYIVTDDDDNNHVYMLSEVTVHTPL